MHFRFWGVPAALFVLLGASGPSAKTPSDPAARFELLLIPSADWQGGRPDARSRVREGRVELFRAGEWTPSLTYSADSPFDAPVGNWLWRAEAPGYVTIGTGELRVPPSATAAESKALFWPVVPACVIELPPEAPAPVQRIDVVSVDTASVRPFAASLGRGQVAAGRVFAYSVTASKTLYALGRPQLCPRGERIDVPQPVPPGRGFQDFLIHVLAPEGGGGEAIPTTFFRDPRGTAAFRPTLTVSQPGRWSFVFYNLPADRELDLAIESSVAQSHRAEVAPSGGSAREMTIELKPLRVMRIGLDYRPARPHGSAELRLLSCGAVGAARGAASSCRPVGSSHKLEAGLHDYRFSSLEDGTYRLDAIVDDEWLPELLQSARPVLAPGEDEEPRFGDFRLFEEEVTGHLFVDDESVAGDVRVSSLEPGRPTRVFATDETGLFRLFYFAGRLNPRTLLRNRGTAEETWWGFGLGAGVLSFCSAMAGCESLHPLSTLLGSGRLDFRFSPGDLVTFHVVDSQSGEPIPGAWILSRSPERVLLFDHGKVEWIEPPFSPGPPHQVADQEGRVAFRLRAANQERVHVTVAAESHREKRIELDPRRPPREVEVELEREVGSRRATLRFPDGTAVANAGITFLEGARWNSRCSSGSDDSGRVEISDRCPAASWALVVHPGALLRPIPAGDLLGGGEVVVERARGPGLLIRFLDSNGAPLSGMTLDLVFPQGRVGLSDLLALTPATHGYLPFFVSDRQGNLSLPPLDLDGPESPSAEVAGTSEPVDLSSIAVAGVEEVRLRRLPE